MAVAGTMFCTMSKVRDAARNVTEESNPVGFVKRLRGLPVIKQISRVIDRFL